MPSRMVLAYFSLSWPVHCKQARVKHKQKHQTFNVASRFHLGALYGSDGIRTRLVKLFPETGFSS